MYENVRKLIIAHVLECGTKMVSFFTALIKLGVLNHGQLPTILEFVLNICLTRISIAKYNKVY